MRGLSELGLSEPQFETAAWTPSIDIQETDKHYLVEADLPGLDIDDIDVSIEENLLTIHGERKFKEEKKKEGMYRSERFEGEFYRRIALPKHIDEHGIEASYKKGVLYLTLPKETEKTAKRIQVKSKD